MWPQYRHHHHTQIATGVGQVPLVLADTEVVVAPLTHYHLDHQYDPHYFYCVGHLVFSIVVLHALIHSSFELTFVIKGHTEGRIYSCSGYLAYKTYFHTKVKHKNKSKIGEQNYN